MPPPKYKTMSIPKVTYDALRLARSTLLRKGTNALPPELRELVKSTRTLTNSQVIELAFAALKMRMDEAKS
jgi:hypothetical protein